MTSDWKNVIFQQKSLWQVYRLSLGELPRTRFNRTVLVTALVLLFAMAGWNVWTGPRYMSLNETAEFVFLLADIGFVFSLSILGFLIAGFSIFASVTKAELFITLANIPYKKTGINSLQFVFFNFLNVFVVYLGLLGLSLVVKVVFSPLSPVTLFGRTMVQSYPTAGLVVNSLVFLSFGILFVEAFLRLKSFIWNLYQSVLMSIATEDQMRAKKDLDNQ